MVKNPHANAKRSRMQARFMVQEDPLEEEMASHSSILAWKIPWIEEADELHNPWSHK